MVTARAQTSACVGSKKLGAKSIAVSSGRKERNVFARYIQKAASFRKRRKGEKKRGGSVERAGERKWR